MIATMTCQSCDGDRTFICGWCDGNGARYHERPGAAKCSVCNGHGEVPCELCGGSGTVEVECDVVDESEARS